MALSAWLTTIRTRAVKIWRLTFVSFFNKITVADPEGSGRTHQCWVQGNHQRAINAKGASRTV